MSIVDKILALRRLSENKSATPAEAANAAARVQELMVKHQITEATLGTSEQSVEWDRDPIFASKKSCKWRTSLAVGVAKVNACRAMRAVKPDGSIHITIVGRASDIEVVRYMYAFIESTIDRLAKEYLKSSDRPNGSGMRLGNSYRLGFVIRIIARLEEQKPTTIAEAREAGQTVALVRVDERDLAVQEWVAKHAPRKHESKQTWIDKHSWAVGTRAADSIAIHSAIAVQSA